jgi:hypothetical protein
MGDDNKNDRNHTKISAGDELRRRLTNANLVVSLGYGLRRKLDEEGVSNATPEMQELLHALEKRE